MFRKLRRFLFYLVTSSVLILGLCLSSLSYLFDVFPEYKKSLLNDLKVSVEWLGQVDNIQLNSSFGHPQLQLKHLKVERIKGLKLNVDEVEINIALFRSIISWQILVDEIHISNGQLSVDKKGLDALLAVEKKDSPKFNQVDWNDLKIKLSNVVLKQTIDKRLPYETRINKLKLKSSNVKKVYVDISSSQNDFTLNAEFKGDLLKWQLWSGYAYANIQKFQTKIIKKNKAYNWLPDSVSGEYWLEFNEGIFTGFTTKIHVSDWKTPYGHYRNVESLIDIDKVDEDHWELDVKNLSFKHAGHVYKKQHFKVGIDENNAIENIKAVNLNLAAFKPLLRHYSFSKKFNMIEDALVKQLSVRREGGDWLVNLSFDSMIYKKQSYRIENLAGELEYNEGKFKGKINASNVGVYLNNSEAIRLKTLHGYILGDVKNGVNLSIRDLVADSDKIRLLGNLKISAGDYVNSILNINTEDLPTVIRLVNYAHLSPGFRHWLNQAFKNTGKLDAKIAYRGQLSKFNLGDDHQAFSIDAKLKDAYFNYKTGWPAASGIVASIMMRGPQLQVKITKANIEGAVLRDMSIVIPKIDGDGTEITVIGDNDIKLEYLHQFIINSPLKNDLEKLAKMTLKGKSRLKLTLLIPMNKKPTTVDGKIQFNKATLAVPDWNLHFGDVISTMHFDKHGFDSESLQGSWFGRTVKGKIIRSGKNASQIQLKGISTYHDLLQYLRLPKLQGDIEGNFEFDATWTIPFGKSTDSSLKIKIKPNRIESKLAIPLVTNLIPDNLLIKFDDHSIREVSLIENDETFTMQYKDGVPHVTLFVKKLDLDEAIGYIKRKFEGSNNTAYRVTLNVTDMKYQKRRFKSVKLDYSHKPGESKITFTTANASGEYVEMRDKHVINLSFLDLAIQDETGDVSSMMKIDKPIEVNVDNLSWSGRRVGSVNIQVTPVGKGYRIDYGRLKHEHYFVKFNGYWDLEKTTIEGSMRANSLKLFNHFFNQKEMIRSKHAEVNFDLTWPGAPWNVEEEALKGLVNLELIDGVIPKLDDKVERKLGIAKVINLLSFSSLARKLSLDFSDVSRHGLDFSIVSAKFKFNSGNLQVKKLVLDGDVLYAKINGNLDLKKKTFDLRLHINPYVTSSLPFIATVAGGPIAGAATWVANKAVTSIIKKKAFYLYHVSGPWDDPVVKKLSGKSSTS